MAPLLYGSATFRSRKFLVCIPRASYLELPSIGLMVGGMAAHPSGNVSSLLG
jgi:hypothetical protein